MENQKTLTKEGGLSSIKVRVIATIISIVAAVALPQALHVFGAMTGLGTLPGETYLPMHLPVIVAGFLAGPAGGLITGAVSPMISSALTGMPPMAMLPFMVIELAAYGLFAGLISKFYGIEHDMVIKVLLVQIAGRVVRGAAILIAFYGLGMKMVAPASIWMSVIAGIPGIVIQLVAIPLIIAAVNKAAGGNK